MGNPAIAKESRFFVRRLCVVSEPDLIATGSVGFLGGAVPALQSRGCGSIPHPSRGEAQGGEEMKTLPGHEPARHASCVFIIEDDALIGMLYEQVLTEMGHKVCALATTQTGAIAAAARFKPDLMIVDVGLSEGSGLAAAQTILRDGFVPHIFITGDGAGLQQQMPGAIVLRKPFVEHELARAIQRALSVRLTP